MTRAPVHRAMMAEDLVRLGLGEGDLVLVHASLRSLGFVVGGAVAVVEALRDAIGERGTLVVPTTTSDNSDPSRWASTRKQAVPESWWPEIRSQLPAFDPAVTPSHGVGTLAETVRTWPGARRSRHPQTSFAALGADAEKLMAVHDLDCHYGPASPLGTLAGLPAKILLLGVPYAVCTAFHHAEYFQPDPPVREYECVIDDGEGRRWYRYRDVVLDDSDFGELGAALEASPSAARIRRGPVGEADCRLVPLGEAVHFATGWFAAHRW